MNYKICRKILNVILILLIVIFLAGVVIYQRNLIAPLFCSRNVSPLSNEVLLDTKISILVSASTIMLSIITIVIRALYQNENKEERRLSFQPFLCSKGEELTYKEFEILKQKQECIILQLQDLYSSDFDINSTQNIIENIKYAKEYIFIKYFLKNIGRDSAVNIEMTISKQETFRILSLQKGEEKTFLLVFKPDDLNKECSFNFTYDALDDKKYSQNEKVCFDNSFKNDDINPGWSVDFKGLSSPKQICNFKIV